MEFELKFNAHVHGMAYAISNGTASSNIFARSFGGLGTRLCYTGLGLADSYMCRSIMSEGFDYVILSEELAEARFFVKHLLLSILNVLTHYPYRIVSAEDLLVNLETVDENFLRLYKFMSIVTYYVHAVTDSFY